MEAIIVGIGATATVDAWSALRSKLFRIPPPDYGLVGRWIGHMPRGRFRHERIAAVPPVPGEKLLGWVVHYAIGVAFALLLVALWGLDWLAAPTPAPAMIVGLGTVAAPFFVMQPAMGAGIAASRTPKPSAARVQSVVTHAVFGAGLYLTASVLSFTPLRP